MYFDVHRTQNVYFSSFCFDRKWHAILQNDGKILKFFHCYCMPQPHAISNECVCVCGGVAPKVINYNFMTFIICLQPYILKSIEIEILRAPAPHTMYLFRDGEHLDGA